ncbi:patatin-domain-containing protein [Dacryopinax primogenitus]|uniref:Patatin-like phospholipase domain-containing protein n=1 Tax=Dacryopinax primogenitus (strain DJM 731) TaxID=1858805 RepID=M5GGW4_DACPD|nr:patatin-domain-containing protein [Dacryopinax primogenitus]EJU06193.1 patatin-domain-containing protein [Dacryopinax primogenitus]
MAAENPGASSLTQLADSREDELWNADYVNEEHIMAFARALSAEDILEPESPVVSPLDSRRSPPEFRVRKVSAVSDFAPISTKVKRRKTPASHGRAQEWSYQIFRWPLLLILFLIIFAEFYLYVLIRQIVNVFEWVLAWRGRKRLLRRKLRSAKTYEEWKSAATMMDEYLDFNIWKHIDEDPYYDYQLVKKVRRSLRLHKERNDIRGLIGVLEVCLRPNFAGTENPRLYSETFYGTKILLESYVKEVESCLAFVRNSNEITVEERRRFFRDVNRGLGSSALCLSGGATFGYYSFGVIKAFLDANLLPRVIAGTSAGGLVAALTCTRTEEELRQLLVPRLADKITACEDPFRVWFKRLRQTGARFDTVAWARKATFFTRGSLTFREAYERTGRALNISVVPFDQHSPTKLLNYLTAPDCVIWSAMIASAAVPGILNPVVLMQKTKDGSIIPWNWGSKFKDGSLRVDIPIQSLNILFNVNHPIVSQVNPHVHLFFFAPQGSPGRPVAHRKGKGWRGGFFLSAAEQYLKLELTKNFKVIRDLELMPQLLGQDWSSVFLQRFDGSVTIWPKTRFMDWINILTDPDRKELERKMRVGELVTWPKLHMIENRFLLEREILRGRLAVRQTAVVREAGLGLTLDKVAAPNQPVNAIEKPTPDGDVLPERVRRKRQISIDSDAESGFNNEKGVLRRSRLSATSLPDDAVSVRSLPASFGSDWLNAPPVGPRKRRAGRASPAKGDNKLPSTSTTPAHPTRSPSFISRLRSPFVSAFAFHRSPHSTPPEIKEEIDETEQPLQDSSSSDTETDIAWLAERAAQASPSFMRLDDGAGMDEDDDS